MTTALTPVGRPPTSLAPARPGTAAQPGRLRRSLSDAGTLTLRVLLNYRHSPGLVAASLAAPLAMLVVFGFVFGSALHVPGSGTYRDYLMPGLFVQVAFNGVVPSMVGAARDVGRGITDRLRSMPISRASALLGQTLADLLVSIVVLAMMVGFGLVSGWRVHDGALRAIAAIALLLLFRFVMNWVGIFLGLLVGKEDIAGQLSVLILPIGMVTNIFVPTGGMPGWLRAIADWNPISAVAAATRDLFGNAVPATGSQPWPLAHPVVATLAWSALLLLVFAPLAVRRFTSHGR